MSVLRESVRYRATHQPHGCNLAELVGAVIGGPEPEVTGRAVTERFPTLVDLAQASPAQLSQIPGVGPAGVARLRAAVELGHRLAFAQVEEGQIIRSSAEAAEFIAAAIALEPVECLYVIPLNIRNKVLGGEILYRHTRKEAVICAGDIFRTALGYNASAVIIGHNHPSGDPTPSPDDIQVTRELRRLGDVLGVKLLDHLIVAPGCYFSLREHDLGFE